MTCIMKYLLVILTRPHSQVLPCLMEREWAWEWCSNSGPWNVIWVQIFFNNMASCPADSVSRYWTTLLKWHYAPTPHMRDTQPSIAWLLEWQVMYVNHPWMFIVRGIFTGSREWSKWIEWFNELWSSSLPHPREKSLVTFSRLLGLYFSEKFPTNNTMQRVEERSAITNLKLKNFLLMLYKRDASSEVKGQQGLFHL